MHAYIAWIVIGVAALTFVVLLFIPAPYGRHGRQGWGPSIPARWAWVVMESPASLAFAVFFLMGAQRGALVPLVLLAGWQLHYIYRAFVYPFRIDSTKATPIVVVALAIAFNMVNAWLNASQLSNFGLYTPAWLYDPRFLVGAVMFFAGRRINRRADETLLTLRSLDDGYRVPHGGMYRYVSCPNYFGEIIQWLGWAIATWSLAGLSFAIFTAANLVPRALSHHAWYRKRFADYPRARRAVFPFVL